MQQTISRARCAETEKLIRFLRTATDGRTITYEEVRKEGGFGAKDKESRVRSCLRSACNALLREDAVVFAAVNGIGVKRATDEEVAGIGKDAVGRMRRLSARTMKKLATIDSEKMPAAGRAELLVSSAQLSAIGHLGSRSAQNKISQRVIQSNVALDVSETLALAGRI